MAMTILLRAGLCNIPFSDCLSASCEKKELDFCLNYFCKSSLFARTDQACVVYTVHVFLFLMPLSVACSWP